MHHRDWTITSLSRLIQRKELSPVELLEYMLRRCEGVGADVNAFITVTDRLARRQARAAEREIMRGSGRGPLHGIPVSFKDIIHVRNIPTTGGSRILRRFVPKKSATVVNRLLDQGVVILGKTNLHEFAYGVTSINPHFGPVRNPWDRSRIAGGSSGGSAAAIACCLGLASMGTDTGGSIRIPASACGVVGLKPSYGLVPMDGIIPLAPSLDHVGPLTRSVEDAALILDAVAANRRTGVSRPYSRHLKKGIRGLRIGLPRQYFLERIDGEVRRHFFAALTMLEQEGARIEPVSVKGLARTGEIGSLITVVEALSYHDRWLARRPYDYGRDLRERMSKARGISALDYFRAQEKRAVYTASFEEALQTVDLVAAPTLPVEAPRLECEQVEMGRSREDVRAALLRLTRPADLTGLPSISTPCGYSRAGMPLGIQFVGPRYGESLLLRVALSLQGNLLWHRKVPPDPGCSRSSA